MTRMQLLVAVIAVFAAAQVCFAYYSYESDYDDWLYDVGMPSTQSGGVAKCKKDLLLVVDTSYSIGETSFNEDVKPFLKRLVLDPLLNVGETGTQIGLIIFSEAYKTKILLNFGKIRRSYDAGELAQFIKELNWKQVSGGHTRTDVGLKLANKIFSGDNPSNNRPDVDDVVVIITDGEPRGRSNTLQQTKKYANDLKEKGVLVVGAAVGPDRRKFKHILEELATSPKYVLDADFNQMDDILAKLVASSCIKPSVSAVPYYVTTRPTAIRNSIDTQQEAQIEPSLIECQCSCHGMTSTPVYVKPGDTTALVEWPIPRFSCKAGRKATLKKTTVTPELTSPHSFAVGEHIINYTFSLKGGVSVTCPVTITVKGELCHGVVFSSENQVCCCGTIHPRKPKHDCCGPDYFDTSDHKCCANANLVSSQDSCPNH